LTSAVFGLALSAPTATARKAESPTTVRSADVVPSFDFGTVEVNHTRTVQLPFLSSADALSASTAAPFGAPNPTCIFLGLAVCDLALTFTPTSAAISSGTLTVTELIVPNIFTLTSTLSGRGVTSDPSVRGPYWPGWDIARGVAVMPTGDAGYVLDGYGGLHRYSEHGVSAPPAATHSPSWPRFNIARGVALLSTGTGGYVLDAYGALHPFAVGGNAPPPPAQHFAYWPGHDIARGVTLLESGRGGYVVDLYGGIHGFSVGADVAPPTPSGFAYWPGHDIARGIAAAAAGGGWVVDLYGGTHRFTSASHTPPALTGLPYFRGFPIVRGLANREAVHATVVDGYGGIHVGGK
jgi:hypothetical protein